MYRPFITSLFSFALLIGLSAAAEARTHVVAQGETITSIAQAEQVSASDIARLNDLQGSTLAPGQVLALDEQSAQSAGAVTDPAAVRARIAAVEAAMQPTAGADLAMWGGGEATDASAASGSVPADEKPSINRLAKRIIARTSEIAVNLTHSAMRFIGVPYSFGGTTSSGFDCSGFVQHVFGMLGIRLPRTADAQYAAAHGVGGHMLPGDLVFFQTYETGPSHVGIYVGDGEFIHASSSHGVMVSRLSDTYWAARYLGAKRVVASR